MYVDLAFINCAELTAAVMGRPVLVVEGAKCVESSYSGCFPHTRVCWWFHGSIARRCVRHGVPPLGWQAPAWSCIARALPHPDSGLQGSASLGLAAAFAALWEPALQFWIPSFSNKNILKHPAPRCSVCFLHVYPIQRAVFLSLFLPAEQFVRWLVLHALRKCLFGLN